MFSCLRSAPMTRCTCRSGFSEAVVVQMATSRAFVAISNVSCVTPALRIAFALLCLLSVTRVSFQQNKHVALNACNRVCIKQFTRCTVVIIIVIIIMIVNSSSSLISRTLTETSLQ